MAVTKKVAKKPKGKRTQTPRRFRSLRKEAMLSSAAETIEQTFDLPSGSVKFVSPTGRSVINATVEGLRRKWDK